MTTTRTIMRKADTRPVILLTGFGPFPGIENNASADLVTALARVARRALNEHRVAAAILPTEWARGPQRVEALHRKHRPVAALHFGVAADARGFRIECQAANSCRRSKDAAGAWPPASRLSSSGPSLCVPAFDAKQIAAALEAKGYPFELSHDAGGYLCNAVFYHSLEHAEREARACRIAFVHIPADLSRPEFDVDRTKAGAFEIVKLMV